MNTPLRKRHFVTAMLACSLLFACESGEAPPAAPGPVVALPVPAEPAPTPPVEKPSEVPPVPRAKPAAPVPIEAAALVPPPPPPVTLRLNGLSMAQTEAELGRPAMEADRAPAKVWQYRSGDCAVDVYFYLDMARNGFYALHHDAKRGEAADEECIRVVQEAGRVR